jgi:hypothetical protein
MSNSSAVEHSLKRLEKARAALSRLEAAPDLTEAERAWSDLLHAAAGVHTKLEQGSKKNDATRKWYAQKKSERTADQLLSYAHHARNSDEHRLDEITTIAHKGSASITIREPYDPSKLVGVQIAMGTDGAGNVRVSSSNESVVSVGMYSEDCLRPVTVCDRGVNYQPPLEHLGTRLPDQSPVTLGRLLIAYIDQLIRGARSTGV